MGRQAPRLGRSPEYCSDSVQGDARDGAGAECAEYRPVGQVGQRARSWSPAISASSIARPETTVMSEATEDSLIPASSSSFSRRWTSRPRSRVIAVRARVRSRSSPIGAGGTNEPRTRPWAPSWAYQVASATSVLGPGRFFTCRALTSITCTPSRSSRRTRTVSSSPRWPPSPHRSPVR